MSKGWWRGIPGEEHVMKLDRYSFDHFVSQADRPAFIMFFAQWCGYSNSARRGFAALAEQLASEGNPIMIGAVDCDECQEIRGRYREITGYPAFLYFVKGNPKLHYQKQRTREAFYNWLMRAQSEMRDRQSRASHLY